MENIKTSINQIVPRMRIYSIVSFLMDLLVKGLFLVPPIIMKNIIDTYIPNKDTNSLLLSILVFIMIPLLIALGSSYYNYKLAVIGRNSGKKIMLKSIRNIINQPLGYFKDKNSVELAEYCSMNSMKYINFWLMDIPQLVSSVIIAIGVYVYILIESIQVGAILLAYPLVLLLPSFYIAKKINSLIKRVIQNNAKSKQQISDTFRGISFVKSMNLEDRQLKSISNINDDTVSIWSKVAAYDNLDGVWVNSVVNNIFIGILFALSALSVVKGELSIGFLLIILMYLPFIFKGVQKISDTNLNFKKQMAEYDKLFEILNLSTETHEEYSSFKFDKEIIIDKLHFSYEDNSVLRGVDMVIPKGKWIGIIGESGAGKSTTFDLLLKLISPDKGSILIDDINIQEIITSKLRENITKISQDTFIFPGTIKDNLLLVKPGASDFEILNALVTAGLEFIINEDLLNKEIGESGVMLSGGERQRLALAQGILRKSQVLLLDEVTGNLDSITETNLRNRLMKLQKDTDVTIIAISHKLEFLMNSDLIYYLKNGKISQMGTYDELSKNNELFNIK